MNRNLTLIVLLLILAGLCTILWSGLNNAAAERERQAIEQKRLRVQVQQLEQRADWTDSQVLVYGTPVPCEPVDSAGQIRAAGAQAAHQRHMSVYGR